MPTDPYTPAELDLGARAMSAHLGRDQALPSGYTRTAAGLDAVLPDHDARVRADERARVAEEIARHLETAEVVTEAQHDALDRAAAIARAHATTEGDPS